MGVESFDQVVPSLEIEPGDGKIKLIFEIGIRNVVDSRKPGARLTSRKL
jgi:hypothetical protein